MSRVAAFFLVFALGVASTAAAQGARQTSPSSGPSKPASITGLASSARYCIAEDGANIHDLGWVAAQTTYAITLDADFDVLSAITRLDLSAKTMNFTDGPEFNRTASTNGTMVLHVASKTGRAGCYRYKVIITPPSTTTSLGATADALHAEGARVAPLITAEGFGPASITGTPSSGQFCVAGSYVAGVHEIGRLDRDSRVTITFDVDFNTTVGVTTTILNPSGADARYLIHDTSGDNRNPSLDFSARAGDHIVLFVSGINGATGCYRYNVAIR